MPGPVPTYRPTFTTEQIVLCRQTIGRHSARQDHACRARLAVLLHEHPALDNVAAGRRLGKHEHWVRYWRRIWATEGFRLTDRPGELIKLLTLVAEERGNVISVEHHREGMDMPVTESEVELTLTMRDRDHCAALVSALEERGYPVQRVR